MHAEGLAHKVAYKKKINAMKKKAQTYHKKFITIAKVLDKGIALLKKKASQKKGYRRQQVEDYIALLEAQYHRMVKKTSRRVSVDDDEVVKFSIIKLSSQKV